MISENLKFRIHFADVVLCAGKNNFIEHKEGSKTVYSGTLQDVSVKWTFTPYRNGSLIDLEISSDKPLNVKRIDSVFFTMSGIEKSWRIAFLGRDWLENENRYPHELAVNQEYTADCVGAFSNLAGKSPLVAGCIPFGNFYKSVAKNNGDGSFDFSAKTEFTVDMLNEKTLRAERVFFADDLTIADFCDDYRSLLEKSDFSMPKLKGWNTWDYYLDRVFPQNVEENVKALKSMPFADQFDYVLLDDGWQKEWGVWRENEKFACGLEHISKIITDAGYIPGLWMAPLAVRPEDSLLKERPEWFIYDENKLFQTTIPDLYYLDLTRPDVLDFIVENYVYQYNKGIRVFKMDYIFPILRVRKFYDKTQNPYGAIKNMVERIKSATGDDAVILGCSLPLECGANVAASMRIGIDVHNHFSHVEWIAQALAWAWMYNDVTTRIDPDFLVVRGEQTADEPLIWEGGRNDKEYPPRELQNNEDRFMCRWRFGDQFNALEAETWANLVAVSGGNIFLSDRLSVLNQKGIDIISSALKVECNTCRPYYQEFDERTPSLWVGDKALLVVNWQNQEKTLTINGIEKDLVSNKPFSLEKGKLIVKLQQHESFCARYKED